MNRREARENAFSMLYESNFYEREAGEDVYAAIIEAREIEDDAFLKRLFCGAYDNESILDEKISGCAHGWKTDRISNVSLSVMRMAIYEMLFCEDIPFSVSINEAVELAKKFDHDKAPKFINGILNAIAEKEGLKDKPEKADE